MIRPQLPQGGQKLATLGYYLQSLILHVQDPTRPVPPAGSISVELQIECYQIASLVVRALSNQFAASWNIEDYIKTTCRKTALADGDELNRFEKLFPPVTPKGASGLPRLMDEPFIVTDSNGRILFFYLPSIISQSHQARIIEAIEWLSTSPQSASLKIKDDGNFRTHPGKFQAYPNFPLIRSGVATYSSAWPQMGHKNSSIAPSANFCAAKEKAHQFLEHLSESLAVLGSILALVHPAMFESGLDVLAYLESKAIVANHQPVLKKVLSAWTSPFTAFSVISNRETDMHCDPCSPQFGFDMLYTGGYNTNG
ncbi:hypothetical protein BKA70DRAFT_1444654 [Coprinopsis sp. MPI-PUGE-AT-0042]|nr:hypothetical protein BKA70DRAFT_1444654 [Coprinopsis sp. MPI-PUGE-AT-0042]